MAKFWARWYEPKVPAWDEARDSIAQRCGADAAAAAVEALQADEFEIDWPFWRVPEHPHMVKHWISGESGNGSYCVVCAVFDAPDAATVRAEIGERESVDVDEKPDDWTPGDRFPMSA